MTITNITITNLHPIENTCCIHWEDGSACYHIWAYQDTLDVSKDFPAIYKNPPHDAPHRSPDYFNTRLLDPDAKHHAASLRIVREFVRKHDLIVKARDEIEAKVREADRVNHIRGYVLRLWTARMNKQPDPVRPDDICDLEEGTYSAALARDMLGAR
jgi:hypothetical protein